MKDLHLICDTKTEKKSLCVCVFDSLFSVLFPLCAFFYTLCTLYQQLQQQRQQINLWQMIDGQSKWSTLGKKNQWRYWFHWHNHLIYKQHTSKCLWLLATLTYIKAHDVHDPVYGNLTISWIYTLTYAMQ